MKRKPYSIILIILILACVSIVFTLCRKDIANRINQQTKTEFTDKSEGFYSPIWSEDGTQIYFIKRDTQARITGGSLLPFMGDRGKAIIAKEIFQIIAKNLKTKQEQILMSTNSPRNGKSVSPSDINNVEAVVKLNTSDKANLDYVLNIGFGAKDYISNYLTGNGQINTGTKISNIGKFIETVNPQKISSDNPFAIKNNLELVVPRGNTSIAMYNYDNQSITLFEKDKYGEFDQLYPQSIKFKDIEHLLKRQSIINLHSPLSQFIDKI